MTTAFTELPWITDPDALKSFLAVMFAVAHPLTNEKTWSLAEREGENVSPFLACTNILFYKMEKKMVWHQGVNYKSLVDMRDHVTKDAAR